jgi:threonine dehydrogenase-like Zn-dependent dehydrogenase
VAARQWGVGEGDAIALEEYLPCGYCRWCRQGEYRHCWMADSSQSANLRFGSTPLAVEPSLWGGFGEYLYLPLNSVVHRLPAGLPYRRAAMALPFGNGFQWAYIDGGVGPGQAVLVQGVGQQGLGCALAAQSVGAGLVIITGRARDSGRLAIARKLGLVTIDVDERDALATVRELTDGEGVQVSIDTTGGSEASVATALGALVRKEGVALLQPTQLSASPLSVIDRKAATVKMTRGHSYRAVELGLGLLAGLDKDKASLLASCSYGLDDVDTALRTAAGETGEVAIHVAVTPWTSGS